jgi:hypothetical protein
VRLAHPSWWALLSYLLGAPPAEAYLPFADHLRAGRCRKCRERLHAVEAAKSRVVQLFRPLRAEAPAPAFGSGLHRPVQTARSADGTWVVLLTAAGSGYAELEIRAPATLPQTTLVAYVIKGADPSKSVTGFLPPQDSALRNVRTSTERLGAEDLVEHLGGEWQSLSVCPLDVATLTAEEATRLDETIQSAEGPARAAWRDWCAAVQRATAEVELPEAVRCVLVRGREKTPTEPRQNPWR